MDNHGALVGWDHQDFGEKIMLVVETVRSSKAAAEHDPDRTRILLTKQQCAVLAQYLMKHSGLTPPKARRLGALKRLLA